MREEKEKEKEQTGEVSSAQLRSITSARGFILPYGSNRLQLSWGTYWGENHPKSGGAARCRRLKLLSAVPISACPVGPRPVAGRRCVGPVRVVLGAPSRTD